MTQVRVHLAPTGLFSPAMTRIADALTRHKPEHVVSAPTRDTADVCLLYAINRDAMATAAQLRREGRNYAILQCCLDTSGATKGEWSETWENSSLLWSYYDLRGRAPNVLYSALGVSSPFIDYPYVNCHAPRQRRVITSGHVSGPAAEEIELVWLAARQKKIAVTHIGASRVVDHNDRPIFCEGVTFTGHISDDELAHLYATSEWVAGLRYVEGYEMPIAEGACCGARGIAFDQPATRRWHANGAINSPFLLSERESRELLYRELCSIFEYPRLSPPPPEILHDACHRYDWAPIASEFWNRLLNQEST